MKVEKARIGDVPKMHQLINYFAEKDEMLPRSLSELYENLRDCFVVRQGEQVVACAALHVFWSDLAEIRSLAVAEANQDQGLGVQLVEACLKEAGELGITTIHITHDLMEAVEMADRVAVIQDGRVEQVLSRRGCFSIPREKLYPILSADPISSTVIPIKVPDRVLWRSIAADLN